MQWTRPFHLDDDALEAPKDELIYAQHVAADEENRITIPRSTAHQPHPPRSPPNAASSPCCSVIWWTPLAWLASLIPKITGKSCGSTKRPVLRSSSALRGILPSI